MPAQTLTGPRIFEAQLRVRYAETDQMGVVYHSNFIVWLEVGRVEMLRQLGFAYSEMEKQDGIHLAVADVHCRFKAPAMYDDLLTIRTRLMNVRGPVLNFAYEIVRSSDGKLLAEAESVHIAIDSQFERISVPQKYLQSFLKAAGKS
jgi:acyl-CoA thioester hydrolase